MDLKTYIEVKGIGNKEFADLIGVSPSTISNYLIRRRKPNLEIGRMIEKVTKGKVTIDELIAYWEAGQKDK